MEYVSGIGGDEELDDVLSLPQDETVELMKRLDGDIMILGIGGKMGPTLAMTAMKACRRAGVSKKVYGVARFSDETLIPKLEDKGITCLRCDLLKPDQIETLPKASNIIFMAGRKFGQTGSDHLTWALNMIVPANVARAFPGSRFVVFSTGSIYDLWPTDTEGPDEAVIDELPEYTAGSGVSLTWTEAADGGIEMVEYRVVVYSDTGLSNRFYVSAWTMGVTADVYGLADGMQYWFVVETRDGFGNLGRDSTTATTTMDASPPMVGIAKGLFGPGEDVTGTCSDLTSGVDTVEVSVNGVDGWKEANVTGGTWSISLSEFAAETIKAVYARATDEVGNTQMDYAMASVDTIDPVVSITMPTSGSDVSGAVVIAGTISDDNLYSYMVEYQPKDGSTWTAVQPEQMTTGVSGVLATWLTAGLAGGDYTVRVTAKDAVDQTRDATVDVTLKGAALTISPADISFSDTHPLPGDNVVVMVTVRNTGDSPAEGVTVTVYADGTSVGEESGVTVPAHGSTTVAVETEAKEGTKEFTARATSPLYDTGTMDDGKPLNTIEAESTMENVAGVLALLALILALVAILLVFVMGRGKGGEPASAPPRDEDVIIDPVLEGDLRAEPEPLPSPEEPMRPRTH